MKSVRLVAAIVMGLLAVVVIIAVGAVGPGDPDGEATAEMESLRSAPTCDSQPTKPAACTWEGEFEFVGSEYHEGHRGHNWYSIDLRDTRLDPDGSPGFVHAVEKFDHEDIEELTYGMPVTATLWRGRIIEVRIDGRELPTSDYPETVPKGLSSTPVQGAVTFRARRAQAAAQNGAAGD